MTEDEVFDGVLRLVSAGEYRDLRHEPIPPAAALAKIARSAQAGWHLQYFTRGTPEYIAARDAGLLEPLPPLTPASPAAVAKTEEAIGYRLPALLRRLYLEVGNGRFGPGYGISDVNRLIRAREDYSPNPHSTVPPALIWIYEFGCDIWSLVDCRDRAGRMWAWDGNRKPGSELFQQDQTLTDWLALWLECRLSEPKGTEPERPTGRHLVRLVPRHPRLVIPLDTDRPDDPANGNLEPGPT